MKIFNLFSTKEPNLIQSYYEIRKECKFQIFFSGILLINFFVLQYSVPISLVLLGSLTTSREQLALFFQKASIPSKDPQDVKLDEASSKKEAEILLGKIIFLFGIITILLGVINNTVRPAESYDTCAKFNSKFSQFKRDLDLQILNKGGLKKPLDTPEFQVMCLFLMEKNDELTKLINEYNEARSLSPRQANIQALNTQENKDELKSTNSASCESIDDSTSNTLINHPTSNSHK
ncbi:hypothetical protein COO91_07133 [Nostoc flagelliforme CCNUN1]|uniref:Uncharacterized protein n=1 Tax=Nostoc flagelliforme CCNUN1 TaxID=2038116 RepID=A0A2K8T0D7_9NOSO|nr:hypothetical protein [Nostoc flagelliforme]AUB41090.1 hypothetical protein COO91_07133 [Nostoc flagelliforme CCNUN1]